MNCVARIALIFSGSMVVIDACIRVEYLNVLPKSWNIESIYSDILLSRCAWIAFARLMSPKKGPGICDGSWHLRARDCWWCLYFDRMRLKAKKITYRPKAAAKAVGNMVTEIIDEIETEKKKNINICSQKYTIVSTEKLG